MRRPSLDQRAVNGEMLARKQLQSPRLIDHTSEEFGGDLGGQEPFAILRKYGMIPRSIIHTESDEPTKQQVVFDLLDEHALAANGVQSL